METPQHGLTESVMTYTKSEMDSATADKNREGRQGTPTSDNEKKIKSILLNIKLLNVSELFQRLQNII